MLCGLACLLSLANWFRINIWLDIQTEIENQYKCWVYKRKDSSVRFLMGWWAALASCWSIECVEWCGVCEISEQLCDRAGCVSGWVDERCWFINHRFIGSLTAYCFGFCFRFRFCFNGSSSVSVVAQDSPLTCSVAQFSVPAVHAEKIKDQLPCSKSCRVL